MKKIKISELTETTDLTGLYTIGTDKNNDSRKVSLQFVRDEVDAAVEDAETATSAANTAASTANTSAATATSAASTATSAASAANTAASSANSAASSATTAAASANAAAEAAETATAESETQTTAAAEATASAAEATTAANEAATAANEATEQVLAAFASLVPDSMTVDYPEEITYGNLVDQYITPTLYPEGTLQNVIYQSDGVAVTVAPDGKITQVAKGTSTIYVIPTCNTAIYQTIKIKVHGATIRKVTNSSLRFTSSGAMRFN